jgi:hypothetical protein
MVNEYTPKSQAEINEFTTILDRLSYLGKERDEKIKLFNLALGNNNWMIGWVVGENLFWDQQLRLLKGNYVILDYVRACELYEDSYFEHFKQHPEELEWLVQNAVEVYDNAQSNLKSGLDYLKQEESSTHIQDITIRNVIARFGKSFQGTELIQIRTDGKGEKWNPANIYFHKPEWIAQPANAKDVWWVRDRYKAKEKSVECFWQSNKFLFAKKREIK